MFLTVLVQHLQLLFCHFCLLHMWETYTYSAYLVFTHNTHTHIYIYIYIYSQTSPHLSTHHTQRERDSYSLTISLCRHSAILTFTHAETWDSILLLQMKWSCIRANCTLRKLVTNSDSAHSSFS